MHDTFVAYMHGNEWAHSFGKSLQQMTNANPGGYISEVGDARCSTGGLPEGRNEAMRSFLDNRDEDWLFFVDTDMGFKPTALASLREIADPTERPVVGGLCFAQREMVHDGRNGYRWEPRPTIFDWLEFPDGRHRFSYRTHYPVNSLVQCDATGTAFVLIHRSVGEKIREHYGDNWFTRIDDPDGRMSEDLSFFKRLIELDGRGGCHIHTGVRTTHAKTTWVAEQDFWERTPVRPATEMVEVIVPVLNRPQNAKPFMDSLRASTGLASVTAVCEATDMESRSAWESVGARAIYDPNCHTFAEKVNFATQSNPLPAPWVFIVGDDVMFHPGWLDHAQHVAQEYGGLVIGTNDLGNPRVTSGDHATHLLIRRDYIEQVGASWDGPGTIAHEGYRHWYVDDEIVMAAKQRGVWQMALGSHVEHMHPYWGKADSDEVYELGQSHAEQDQQLWQQRLAEHSGAPMPEGSFVGFVVDGHGAAQRDVRNGVYPPQLLGFDPYPGTLNLRVPAQALSLLGDPHETVTGPECDLWLWRASINDLKVWLMFPDRQPAENLLEVLAPTKLRDLWQLSNGDALTVTL